MVKDADIIFGAFNTKLNFEFLAIKPRLSDFGLFFLECVHFQDAIH